MIQESEFEIDTVPNPYLKLHYFCKSAHYDQLKYTAVFSALRIKKINGTIIILDKYYLSFINTLNILYRLFFKTQGRKYCRNLSWSCAYYEYK